MKKKSPTIVFFGNERLATAVTTSNPVLRGLIDNNFHITAIVSNHEQSTSRLKRQLEIASLANKHGIPLLLPKKPADIASDLRALRPDVGILVAYGNIVPENVIDIFPCGIINIHPSLLPLHRGPTPLESVLLSGELRTGVSIMQLVRAMDAGPVFAQSEVQLQGNESKQELADSLSELGAAMLIELLPAILDGSVVAKPQDDTHATYDSLLRKESGTIDWRKPAVQLEREIRAFAGWPRSTTTLAQKQVVINSAEVISGLGAPGTLQPSNTLIVFCGKDALEITSLTPAGKKQMTGASFVAGHRSLLFN